MRLERGDTGLRVDDQALVVRVPGIGRRRSRSELVFELSAERHGVVRRLVAGLGEADLDQVVVQLRLDVLPRQELLAPVGELLGAGHRDVAGAQFLGEGGEHHRLEVLAHEGAGPVLVADRLLPVQRGERDVDRAAVLVPFGQVVAQVLVAPGVRESVQDAAVLGGGRQFQAAGQVVHRGAVLEQMPVQQHLPVVAVVGCDLLNLLVLALEPAEAVHRRRGHPQRAGLHPQGLGQRVQAGCELVAEPRSHSVGLRVLVEFPDQRQDLRRKRGRLLPRGLDGAVGVDVLEHGAVVPDQRLDDGLLLLPDLLQLRLGPLDLQRDPLGEHRGQVVPGPHPCLVDQAHQQREPLD
ncbi:hypothetical protein [Streptomyces sp. NPDC015350]|uniref:hypothetical protein n=1 Tax=Streptomyces sp. NPDC015350 TaxID=3364955 RepID=UPI0037028203